MKKRLFRFLFKIRKAILTLLIVALCTTPPYFAFAHVTLLHSYSFNDGAASDLIGYADGSLVGNGNIPNGDYLGWPANKTSINSHSAISLETNIYSEAGEVLVTFQVDMKNESYNSDSVMMIASWNDWTPMPMTADGEVYSLTAILPIGSEYQYKFIKGLTDWESVPDASCTAEGNDNRIVTVPDTDTVLPLVCYGACETCINWFAPQISIREIQGESETTPYLDQDIKTEGAITALNQYGAYIQDASDYRSGIWVYEPNLINQYSRGQSVHFIATPTEYNGLTELVSVQFDALAENNYVVSPLNIEIAEIGEETEGVLSKLSNVEVLSINQYNEYVVQNELGDTALIGTYFYQPILEIGSFYNITGVVDYRFNKFLLSPRDEDDLQNLSLPMVDVTFRVNMQNEIVSANGVHLNGSFSDWATAVEMNVDSADIYSVTLSLYVGQTYTYKFVNGGTFEWEYYEIPPEKCTSGENNDREITVPEANIVLDVVCFNSCYNCDKPDELNVSINRTPVAPLVDGIPDNIWDKVAAVPIERDFLGESPTVTASWKAMYDDDNIYILVEVQDDDHYPAWEAGSGNFWEYDQAELFFDVNNLLLDGLGPSAGGSGHWVFSQMMQETGYGNLQESYALAAPVSWCYTLSGQNYTIEYAFPFNSLTQNDGTVLDVNDFKNMGAFGFDVTIDDRDLTKDSRDRKVWQNIGVQDEAYNNMDDCGTISLSDEIIARDSVTVTFLVDMQNEEVDSSGVFVIGDWDPSAAWQNPVPMNADNNVYWVVVKMPVGTSFNYKFLNGENWEYLQGFCATEGYADRHYDLGNEYAVLDLVCFGSCYSCKDENIPLYSIQQIQGDGDVSPLLGQVVKTKGRITAVNQYGFFMQDTYGVRSGIYVYDTLLAVQLNQGDNIEIIGEVQEHNGRTGLFNTQWFDYTNESFEIYLTGVDVSEIGEDYESVFVALNDITVVEQNAYGEYVAVSESQDTVIIDNVLIEPVMEVGRSYIVYGIVDYTYGRYAVNPRAQAGIIPFYNLTFRVDMQNEEISPDGVFVGGDWNDWMSWENPDTMVSDGNVYSASIKLTAGRYINYKFKNGGEWEIVLGDCAAGDNGDRYFVMPDSDTTLDLVCFNKCISCDSLNSTLPQVEIFDLQTLDAPCSGSTGEVVVNFSVSDVGNIVDCGVLIGSVPNILIGADKHSGGAGAGEYSVTVDNLNAGTYFMCAYAENEFGTSYSDIQEIMIMEPEALTMDYTETLNETSMNYVISGFGGIPDYSYSITICDEENNCTGQSWQPDNNFTFTGLQQLENYLVLIQVMDQNGCIAVMNSSFMLAPENSLEMDSVALVALYNSTDGANWNNNENWLTGPIDTWNGVTVQNDRVVAVDLHENNLAGTLPSRIGKLSALQSFVLWGNQLTGELPSELGDMSSLRTLDLGLNQFVGQIPPQLGNLTNLNALFIGSGSQLSGEIPASLGQLTNLTLLALDGNQLEGTIPPELGALSQLQYLFLHGNLLYGYIPETFGQLQSLNVLNLGDNILFGQIPVDLCNLPLSEVNFEQNYFNIYACDVIRCLTDNGVTFIGDPAQTQKNGNELTNACYLPSLSIVEILAPQIANSTLCNPAEDEAVSLRFYNDGAEPVDSATLFYMLNGDTIAVETYPQVIMPGDTVDFEFTTRVNLKPAIYMQNDTLKVRLGWSGGMINGWMTTLAFRAINNDTNSPDWSVYNTCNGLTRNASFSISEDIRGNIWSTHFGGIEHFNGEEWDLYTTEDGLAENYSWAIEQDGDGNLWIAGTGQNKITLFNGNRFIYYDQPAVFDECIYADTQGNVWFGSFNGDGVAKFDGQNWTYYDSGTQANFGNAVLSIGEDVNGNMYFSTSSGITMFDGSNWSVFTIPENFYQISEIFYDTHGFTWFAGYNTFYRYDGTDWTVFSDPDYTLSYCSDITEDLDGSIWFGGGQNLIKFDGGNWTKYTPENGMLAASVSTIFAVYADSRNDIWVGTNGGGISKLEQTRSNLGMLDLVSPVRNSTINFLYCGLTNNEPVTVSIYNDGDFPVENAVLGFTVDNDTISLDTLDFTIQVGDTVEYTFENGADFYHTDLVRIYQGTAFIVEENGNPLDNVISENMRVDGDFQDAPGWTTYNSCDGLLSDVSWAITEDGNGNIWSNSFDGADIFDGNQWMNLTVADGLTENYSWAIDHDQDGNIWFAGTTDSSITRFDGSDFTVYPQPGIYEECMYNDSKGNMWFGSFGGSGVARFDGSNWTYFPTSEIGCGSQVISIGEDKVGNIILSSNNPTGVVFVYDGTTWEMFQLPEPLNESVIIEIYFDSKGNTWLATYEAISKFDGSEWEHFSLNDGIPMYADDISEDIYGNIWFGGVRELVRYDGNTWTKYTENDGLAAASQGNIYSVYADTRGNVWVGTYRGGISKFEIPSDEICGTLQLDAGWNLFSVPFNLDSARVGYNFQPLIDNGSLVKIQDELGNAFEDQGIFGGWDDSEMKLIRPFDGFKINVSRDDSVQFCGTPVTYPYPIYLYEGWNIMGYPQTVDADADEVMAQLIDHGTLLKVQDETGNSIEDLGIFGGWFNFIGNFSPGEGYKVKMNTNDTLWIYDTYTKSTVVAQPKVLAEHFTTELTGNGVDHMNLNIVDLPLNVLNAGDELAIYDGSLCVGAVSLLPHNLESGVVSIAVSAADMLGMPGFGEGNAYNLRLWKADKDMEIELNPDILKGPAVFVKHESAVLSLKNFTGLEEGLFNEESVNCYPNPFREELIVEANFASEKNVEIQIFNQTGQIVNYLVPKQEVNAGLHRWTWKGDNRSGQKVKPGVYYLRFHAGERVLVQKIVLTR